MTGATASTCPGSACACNAVDRLHAGAEAPLDVLAELETATTANAYLPLKRAVDIVSAFLTCVLLLPLAALICVVVACETRALPIYSETRVGRGGKDFRILKFRTMVADAADIGKYLSEDQLGQWQRERKVENDPRVTRFGRLLRKVSLDELPQFVNVLLGDMSVIGPRAITRNELRYFGNAQALLLSVRPGISGAWQCSPRSVATFANGERQRLELQYVCNPSLATDLRLALRTFSVMFIVRQGR